VLDDLCPSSRLVSPDLGLVRSSGASDRPRAGGTS
jgi:hypothetical protein